MILESTRDPEEMENDRRELIAAVAAVAAHTGLDPKQVASVLTGLTEGAKRRPERHRTSGRPGRTSSPCGSSRTKDADESFATRLADTSSGVTIGDGPPRGACPSWGVPTRRDSGAPAVCLPPGRRRATERERASGVLADPRRVAFEGKPDREVGPTTVSAPVFPPNSASSIGPAALHTVIHNADRLALATTLRRTTARNRSWCV